MGYERKYTLHSEAYRFISFERYSGMGTEHAAFLGVGFNAGARTVTVE